MQPSDRRPLAQAWALSAGRSPCPGVLGLSPVWPVGGRQSAGAQCTSPLGVPALYVFKSPSQGWTFVRPEAPPPYPSFGSTGLAPSPAPFWVTWSTPQSWTSPGSTANGTLQSLAVPGPCLRPWSGCVWIAVSVWSEDAASDTVVLSPHTCPSRWRAGPSLACPCTPDLETTLWAPHPRDVCLLLETWLHACLQPDPGMAHLLLTTTSPVFVESSRFSP